MDSLNLDQGELSENRPTLNFEEGSYSLPELLESHLLPVVAQYDSESQPLPFDDLNFDLTQPLLLYKKRNIQKVGARSLLLQGERYEEVGESLLIPEDYKGWFAVLQRVTGVVRADDTVPHFTSVEELAVSNTDTFLVGGSKKISGLQIIDRSSTQLKHEQRHFLPGDVLAIEKIYYGETRKRTRLFRKSKYITEKFLMCRDEADREVLLPFEQTGIFYQVAHKTGKATKNVLQMSDIVARKLTPRIIKLVFGRFPVTPCSFTGLMKADSSRIETSIIACTIVNTKNILLEIPVSSAFKFRVALTDDTLRKNACFRSAMSLCAERANTYMRNIKVCHNFTLDDDSDARNPHTPLYKHNSMPFQYKPESSELQSFRNGRSLRKTVSAIEPQPLPPPRITHSVEIPDEMTIRPARRVSTGRMSFCLGNNYLTVPVFEPGVGMKRNSGNNNTTQEAVYTTRRGSRLSFNGQFFEEETEGDEHNKEPDTPDIEVPPALAGTTIGSYLNIGSAPKIKINSEPGELYPWRPTSQPPSVSPPPLPRSTSTSGVSSASTSSVSDGTVSNRGSTESFEYAVPKIDESRSVLKHVAQERSKSFGSSAQAEQEEKRVRRPSTFTFSEGCFTSSRSACKLPSYEIIRDEDETKSDDSSPIYENITSLMEVCSESPSSSRDSLSIISDKPIKAARRTKATLDKLERLQDEEGMSGEDLSGYEDETNEERLIDGYDIEDDVSKSEDFSIEDFDELYIEDGDPLEVMNDFDNQTNATDEYDPRGTTANHSMDDTQVDMLKGETDELSSIEGIYDTADPVLDIGMYDEWARHGTRVDIDIGNGICEENGSDFQARGPSVPCSNKGETETYAIERTDTSEIDLHLKACFVSDFNHEEESAKLYEHEHSEEVVSQIDETSNVKPSDYRKRWRVAVNKVMSDNQEGESETDFAAKYMAEPSEKPLECFTSDDIAVQLKEIGIRETSIKRMQFLGVDGSLFQRILEGELSIRECLTGVNLIDQQKISMFIRGWRPATEC